MEKEERLKLEDLLGAIMTRDVNKSEEEYAKLIDAVSENYDKNNEIKGESKVSLEERRERIRSNYYGTSMNMLLAILNLVNDFTSNYSKLIEAIAEKVGVDFEHVQTEEDKAMEAAAEYLRASAEKKRAEKALIDKQNLNREQRRKIQKTTGEVIQFKKGE